MLYVVMKETGEVLGKWDAWYIGCEEEAMKLIVEKGLEILEDVITLMGNRIMYVK